MTFTSTWRHIRRSPYQAFAAMSTMTLTFLVAGLFLAISFASVMILDHFEQKPEIIVFFKDTKKEADIKSLQGELETSPKVASVKYISKEEALAIYREQFKDDPLLLEMVSAEILPASIEVSAVKIEYLPELAGMLRSETEVSDIVFPEEVINLLVSWTNVFRQMGLVLVVFLTLVSLFTVVTVVSMKIALRREEIEILQLVGASRWYIRMPFLLEGLLYGVTGALFGAAFNLGLLLYAIPFLKTLFVGIPLFPVPLLFYFIFFGIMLAAGSVLGIMASALALNRYLR